MDKTSEDRINEMIEAVIKVARGNYSVQIELSDKNDDLDSLAMGINMMIDDVKNEIIEHKQAEEELRSSEERLRILFEDAPDAYYLNDLKGTFLDGNKAAEKIIGYKKEELIGKSFLKLKLLSPAQMPRAAAGLARNALGKPSGPDEFIIKRKDGSQVPVEIRTFPVKIKGKAVVLGIARDITDRKQAESEKERILHSLQERYKELNCLYGIDEINRRKGITIEEVFKEIVRLIPPGWQYPEITGGCITFEDRKYKTRNFKRTKWMQRADIIVNNEKAGLIEVCYLENKPGSDEGPFLKEESNLINAMAERLGQIIKQKLAEESLKKLSSALEQTADLVVITDKEGVIEYVNPSLEKLTNYTKEETIGKTPRILKSGKLKKSIYKELWETILSGRSYSQVFINKKKGGNLYYEEKTISPIKDAQGNITHFVSTGRDITERKRTEKIIKKSLKEKEVLLKEIHHRVKNNMQVISSLLRIQSGSIEDEKIQEMFYALHDRIKSMSLLYELLYESKDIARVDLSEYIRGLTTHLMSMYRDRVGVINFKVDVKDVYLDLKRAVPCGLIITELVSNTLKHAFSKAERGEITVEMHPDKGEKYTLVIRDSGKGFPEELDFRETESLGMKLVVDLVKQLKGTIELDRTKGTIFSIRFRRKQ